MEEEKKKHCTCTLTTQHSATVFQRLPQHAFSDELMRYPRFRAFPRARETAMIDREYYITIDKKFGEIFISVISSMNNSHETRWRRIYLTERRNARV